MGFFAQFFFPGIQNVLKHQIKTTFLRLCSLIPSSNTAKIIVITAWNFGFKNFKNIYIFCIISLRKFKDFWFVRWVNVEKLNNFIQSK